jgi:hypothetical protein
MVVQGFVTRTGARKITKNGKELFFPWINVEGAFLNMGFGVAAPDQNREIRATVNVQSYKVQAKNGADNAPKGAPGRAPTGAPEAGSAKEEWRNNLVVLGWTYLN